MKQLIISDVTLREEAKRAEISFKEKIEIARLLEKLCADVIELPAIVNDKSDSLLVRTVAALVRNSTLCLYGGETEDSVRMAAEALTDAQRPRIQISLPMSPVRMEYNSHKKPTAILAAVTTLVTLAKSLCGDVEFAAEDATRSEPDFLRKAIRAAIDAGAQTITVCDTAGAMFPDEFADFIKELKKDIPGMPTLLVQCSDKLDMATACEFAAVRAGADGVKLAARPEVCAGTDSFAHAIRSRGVSCDIESSLKTTELVRILSRITEVAEGRRPSAAKSAELLSNTQNNFVLDKTAKLPEVMDAVKLLGYDLSEEDSGKVFEDFSRHAERKNVSAAELDAIIASTALQVPPTYALDRYVTNSGNAITSTAHIILRKNGESLQGLSTGDGPIDAAFQAIEQVIGHHYELDDFQISSVTEGHEALGSALVKLRSEGKLYSGKGLSTDIIGASIRAYLNALNKIVYEEK